MEHRSTVPNAWRVEAGGGVERRGLDGIRTARRRRAVYILSGWARAAWGCLSAYDPEWTGGSVRCCIHRPEQPGERSGDLGRDLLLAKRRPWRGWRSQRPESTTWATRGRQVSSDGGGRGGNDREHLRQATELREWSPFHPAGRGLAAPIARGAGIGTSSRRTCSSRVTAGSGDGLRGGAPDATVPPTSPRGHAAVGGRVASA